MLVPYQNINPPIGIFIGNGLYIDKTEVSNINYKEYLHFLKTWYSDIALIGFRNVARGEDGNLSDDLMMLIIRAHDTCHHFKSSLVPNFAHRFNNNLKK